VVDAETCAEFVIVCAVAGAVVLTFSVAAVPEASDGNVHVNVFVEKVQLNGPLVVPNSTPAGNVSETLTFVAAPGPLFVTVIEYVRPVPVTTGSGRAVIDAESSAVAPMMPTVAEFDVVQVPLVTVTLKLIVPDAGALKRIDVVPLPDVIVPPLIDHE
jgi:hypothetical protein